jgi:predicted transcriptional regulator
MSKATKSEIIDEEAEETLAAIKEGIRDARAGRTVPMDKVRKLLPRWIAHSSGKSS